jgi:peptidoglycan/LPS O-acetylase OafA/YrhL
MLLWSSECIQTYGILHNINVLIGMAAVFGWVARGKELNKINISEKIASSTFFIYAYHLIMMVFMLKVWVKIFSPVNDVTLIIGFFVLPILVAAIGMGIYHLLKKILPRFTAIITGGR